MNRLLATSIVSIVTLASAPALACGGFFCTTQPVDQNAERILFRAHDDGTVTAIVEISYSGSAEAFSWVVPVPDDPILSTVPPSTLRLLDTATGVQIIPPPVDPCDRGLFASAENDSGQGGNGEVNVTDLPRVGPFLPRILESDDATALITWLNENDYLITEEMEPYVEAYLGAGMKFLALNLAGDAEVSDIEPIVMNYPAEEIMVPIVLTSIAAEPEMGVMVFVGADQRYEPTNFESLIVNPAQVQMNPLNGRNNYFALISYLVDEAGGRAFVTQFAQSATQTRDLVDNAFIFTEDADEARMALNEILDDHAYITRMYTRISGWEMLADPAFSPSTAGGVSNVIDLSGREPIDGCDDFEDRVPCGDTYCGPGAQCATTESSGDGCVCPSGSVAREIVSPNGGREVHCQPESFDLLQSVEASSGGPCAQNPCGPAGACVVVSGFPTCSCDEGYAAVQTFNGAPRCELATELFAATQILAPIDSSGCGCQNTEPRATLPWILLLGSSALWRSTRRRRVD